MDQAEMKRAVGRAAVDLVKDGMRLGIGTGSTAEAFVHALAQAVGDGLSVVGVPTSERTAGLCMELGVPLTTLDETPELDLTIDGADELDSALNLIKGGGGALLREKIVASASSRMIVIADETKLVDGLGRYPLPIEVNIFGFEATRRAVASVCEQMGGVESLSLRIDRDEEPFVTDGGHYILDAAFGHISDPRQLERALHQVPGVVETGLFIGLATQALIATPDGINTINAHETA
ncbi:MAG: ribose-5-phosphate isomerase RpiA [Pseudomonadota bacterium]